MTMFFASQHIIMGNQVCEQFHTDHVVCPPRLRGSVFTTSAVDNIDYNPSSTTSKESFHGTGISLFQHLKFDHEGVERNITIDAESQNTSSKAVDKLPHYYTEVPPVTDSIKKSSVSVPIVSSLDRTNYKQHTEQEYLWLNHTKEVLAIQNGTPEWVSWTAYHASSQAQQSYVICPNSLLPLFHESAHTLAMIKHSFNKHSFNAIKRAVHHLNPEQIPVITFDQPLYALAKQIQWTWPDEYGEDKYVVMFGGLYIEMAVLKTLGDWLRGSGWVQTLV